MTPCHSTLAIPSPTTNMPIILVGNPNVGKSVIFSRLTRHYVDVSNYPGTTVEVTRGRLSINGNNTILIDTPGTNNLIPRSPDEQVTSNILVSEPSRAVVQVADAKNLTRTLLLTTQLIELGVPLVLVLNMQDEAMSRGIEIDAAALSRDLGIDVIPAVATRGEGLDDTLAAMECARPGSFQIEFDPALEKAIALLSALLPDSTSGQRALSIIALTDDNIPAAFPCKSHSEIAAIRADLATQYKVPLVYAINRQRVVAISNIVERVSHKQTRADEHVATKLGRLPTSVYLVERILPIPLLQDFLVGEYGLVTMALSYGLAIILPIVLTFFIAFSLLEDIGYLPRLAVVLNRPFKVLGLNGKAVLPMVLGLGCDTMATMTTRILETRKERLLVTLLLVLGVPCSAQLGVILGMIGYVSPAAMAIWIGVVTVVMLTVGWLAARLIPGQSSDFVVELPPIRAPRLDNILFKTLARLEWYLKEVLPLFILGTVILFVLDKIGGLALVERLAAPLVQDFLGLPGAATNAFLIGFLRRDYGAAGLFALARAGLLNTNQMIVSLVVITLFIPCIANFLVIIKEYGAKTAAWVTATVVPLAFAVGGLLNTIFNVLGLSF
jgi:ferrous iron transport protein B